MCTFRASCCSARLSRAQITVLLSGTGEQKGGGGGIKVRPSALAGTREYEQSDRNR